MKKITFVTFLSLNLNFDTQFKEFDVGNKGWEYNVSKKTALKFRYFSNETFFLSQLMNFG